MQKQAKKFITNTRTHAHARINCTRARGRTNRKEIMKNYIITIEENLPFPDDEKNKKWTQILNNPTSIGALLITIDNLDVDKKITIECFNA